MNSHEIDFKINFHQINFPHLLNNGFRTQVNCTVALIVLRIIKITMSKLIGNI